MPKLKDANTTQNVVLLGSVGDSPSLEGSGANWAPGDTNIVGSVFLLFIFPFIFFSMVAWGGVHKHIHTYQVRNKYIKKVSK